MKLLIILLMTLTVSTNAQDSTWLKKNGFSKIAGTDTWAFHARDVLIWFQQSEPVKITVYSGSPMKFESRKHFAKMDWPEIKRELSALYFLWLNEKPKD